MRFFRIAAMTLAAALFSSAAVAFPDRPVTIIVPWAAGGGTDMIVRIFAAGFEKELGTTVNVINQPGGNALTGNTNIANADPDGYTLGVTTAEIMYYDTLGTSDLSYTDFHLFSRVAATVAGVTVSADSPFGNLEDLLTAIRNDPPGTYSASGVGIGGIWHIALGGLLQAADIDPTRVRWVPSQGGAPALQEIGAGSVTMFTGSPIEARALIDANRMRGLAMMSREPLPVMPDIPTVTAQGIDYVFECLFTLVGPKGIDEDRIQVILDAAERTLERPDVRDVMIERGIIPVWDEPGGAEAALKAFAAIAQPTLIGLGLGK